MSSIKETHNEEWRRKRRKERHEDETLRCQFNKSLAKSCEEKLDELFAD